MAFQEQRDYTIKFLVGGEMCLDKWPGTTSREALDSWWKHVSEHEEMDFKTNAGWMKVRVEAILAAEVLSHGR